MHQHARFSHALGLRLSAPSSCQLALLLVVLLLVNFGTCQAVSDITHAAAQHAQHEQPLPCTPPVIHEAAIAGHQGGSLLLHDVCLDGEAIVLHDSSRLDTLEAGDGGGMLPSFNTERFSEFHRHASHHPHPLRPIVGSACRHTPLRFRYPSALEVRRATHFSNCTVPVLVFAHWIHAFAEFFTRGPAWMWRLQEQHKLLDKEISIVKASCGSIPLGKHHMQLMQPFTKHQVSSWATFASRASSHSHSNSTAEGTHTRCFSKMLIMGFDHAAWSSTYEAAQYILQYYRDKGMVPEDTVFTSGPTVLKILFEFRTGDAQVHSSTHVRNVQPIPGDSPEVLKLEARVNHSDGSEAAQFRGRPVYPGVRQILNLADVLEVCKDPKWQQSAIQGTTWTGVECQAYTFGANLFEGMAVAQKADMFISLHGSGEMNAMFMRKGTIKIQMRSKEFGTLHRYMSNGYWPLVCHQNDFPYQCWFLNFDEEDTWEPGVFERFGLYSEGQTPSFTRRDRHLRLNMDHLAYALREILPVKDNKPQFEQRWKDSKVAITFNANKTIGYFQQVSRRLQHAPMLAVASNKQLLPASTYFQQVSRRLQRARQLLAGLEAGAGAAGTRVQECKAGRGGSSGRGGAARSAGQGNWRVGSRSLA